MHSTAEAASNAELAHYPLPQLVVDNLPHQLADFLAVLGAALVRRRGGISRRAPDDLAPLIDQDHRISGRRQAVLQPRNGAT